MTTKDKSVVVGEGQDAVVLSLTYSVAAERVENEDKVLLSLLPSHVLKDLRECSGARLDCGEIDSIRAKSGWPLYKVLSVWMRVSGRI